jgi:hypothetical protein
MKFSNIICPFISIIQIISDNETTIATKESLVDFREFK